MTSLIRDMNRRNLFRGIYKYRRRENFDPGENFLTESFSYILASDQNIQRSILEALTSGSIEHGIVSEVETQKMQGDLDDPMRCMPDALITG